MLTSSSTNFYFYQGPFRKINWTNSSFHRVTSDNCIKTGYIFSRYKSVAINLIKVVLFLAGLYDIS